MFNKLLQNRMISYIFFGILSTLVNFGVFYLLRQLTPLTVTVANFISIATAIVFAYFVNSRYVFQSKSQTWQEEFKKFTSFVSARLITMIIELGGVFLMAEVLLWNEMLSKIITNIIVLILNYIFSKFIFKA